MDYILEHRLRNEEMSKNKIIQEMGIIYFRIENLKETMISKRLVLSGDQMSDTFIQIQYLEEVLKRFADKYIGLK